MVPGQYRTSNPNLATRSEISSEQEVGGRDEQQQNEVVGFQVNKLAAKCRKWRKCGKRTKRLQSAQMAVIAEMAQSAQIWRKCRN